jgi:hypothetical protein
MSALVGVGLGVIMERNWLHFTVDGKLGQRVLRAAVGLAIVASLYLGSDLLLPEEMTHAAEAIVTFGLYALLGWTIIFFCPWLFVRLGLAESAPADD